MTPVRSPRVTAHLRRFAFTAMVIVTSWSAWAWASTSTHGKPVRPSAATNGEAKPAETAEAETENEGPEPFNWTTFGEKTPPYIAMLINFGILAAGYYLLGRKPIAAGLVARRDTISKEIDEAQRMKREAEERAKVYQLKLERLENELRATRATMVRAGEAESERIVRDAEAKADRMRKDAELLVLQEMKQIRNDLLRETVEAAVSAAEELLRKRVTTADQERLAEDYLSDLSGRSRPGSISPRPVARSGGPESAS